MASNSFNIFIAWHQEDEHLGLELKKQLRSTFINMSKVKVLDNVDVLGGDDRLETIDTLLRQSSLCLMLLSPDFIDEAKEYWKPACSFHLDPGMGFQILPVFARFCDYQGFIDLNNLGQQVVLLTDKGKPLNSNAWQSAEEPYFYISEAVKAVVRTEQKNLRRKQRSPKEQKAFAELLTSLNFSDQPKEFLGAQIISSNKYQSDKAFGYLIKGKYQHGQDWLYQLLNKKLKSGKSFEGIENVEDLTFYPIPISFGSLAAQSNPARIWTDLGKTLKIGSNANADQVIEMVCNKLATTHIVIFKIDEFGLVTEEMSQNLTQNFWSKIVEAARIKEGAAKRFPIFLFLIDHEGNPQICPETYISFKSESWKPKKPVALSEIKALSTNDLEKWFTDKEVEVNSISNDIYMKILSPEKKAKLIKDLLADTEEGKPELVLSKVCEAFQFNFAEIKDQLAENE